MSETHLSEVPPKEFSKASWPQQMSPFLQTEPRSNWQGVSSLNLVHQTILNDNLETWDLGWMENKNHARLTNASIDQMWLICLHNIATSSIHRRLTTYSSPPIYPTLFPRVFWVPRTDSQETAVVKTPIKLFSKCLNNQERFVPTWKNPRPQGFGHSWRKFWIPQQLLIHLSSPHMLD